MMKNATTALKQVLIENIHTGHEYNITAVLPRVDMIEIIQGLDFNMYDSVYAKYDEGETFLVTSSKIGDELMFFVENVLSKDGEMKHDENDIVVIPSNLQKEIRVHVIQSFVFKKLKSYTSKATYDDFVEFLKN